MRLSEQKELIRIQERITFSVTVDKLQRSGSDIIYMDETTFQVWASPNRTWMGDGMLRVAAPLNKSYLKSVTVFGALGASLKKPVFMGARATNQIEFRRFLDEIAWNLRNPYRRSKPYLVLDNHPAHRTKLSIKALE